MSAGKFFGSRASLVVIGLLLLFVGGGISYSVFQSEKSELVESASEELVSWSRTYADTLSAMFEPALTLGQSLQDSTVWRQPDSDAGSLFFAIATGPIRQFGQLNGAFLGFPDGRFYHVQDAALTGAASTANTSGDPNTVDRRIVDDHDGNAAGQWERFNTDDRQWHPIHRANNRPYDPRTRPWYQTAVANGGPIWTDAYVFSSSGRLGVTYAQPIFDDAGHLWAVMGVDISLESMSRSMVQISDAFSRSGNLVFATDHDKNMMGHPDLVAEAALLSSNADALQARYSDSNSIEYQIMHSVSQDDTVVTVKSTHGAFIATRLALNPQEAMPLHLYLALDLVVVLADAVASMKRNVALLFAAFVTFAVVAVYAVKLRVEVAARQAAEVALVDAKETAEAATKAKSTFLATMSHEIRTPMNGVISMAELLSLTRLDAEQSRMAKIINDSAMALLTIINDILDFSKIEAGKIEIETIDLSLMDIVDGSAELLAPRAEEKGLSLTVDIDPELVDQRLGDPTRLRQILLNLGGNAIKFTEFGSVDIRVRAAGDMADGVQADRLRFEIQDTGIGLTEEQRSKLFQAFSQADSSTSRKFGGTGLGLSICQRLTDLMQGQIGVDSEPGIGSTFWFEVPLPPTEAGPPRSAYDLSGAVVRLVGLPETVADIASQYLTAGGVASIHRDETLDVSATNKTGTADSLWIVDASMAVSTPGGSPAPAIPVAYVGSRMVLAELTRNQVASVSLLTLPLSRPALWHAVAVALGFEVAFDQQDRGDLAYSPPSAEVARANRAMVLVAEDNATNQTVIRQMLGKMGFACEIANNGRIALEMLDPSAHGLLLTDINMPEMDGYELTRHIRKAEIETGAHLPILALTADALSGTDQACFDAGIDACLTKPINSVKLGEALSGHMPQAVSLRVPEGESPDANGTDVTPRPASSWDPDIFDAAVLTEAFGQFDQDAKQLLADAARSWEAEIATIQTALLAQNWIAAREAAHTLKGSSLSTGVKRLGRIASDIQDALDAGDHDMAALFADVLSPTIDEFKTLLPMIMKL